MPSKSYVGAGLHNAHSAAVRSAVTPQNAPSATGQKREGASRSLPARIVAKISPEPNTGCWRRERNPLGLPERSTPEAHEARRATVEPTDWRTRLHVAASTTGARRVAAETSAYAARAERRGELAAVVAFLRSARRYVVHGGTLIDAVADGTLLGWRAREALNSVLDEPVANWDRRKGRTQLERIAVVTRALAELGDVRKGGWSIAR